MFKKLTKFLVSQMDPSKDLVPVESIANNEHFRPLYLLKRKSKPKTIFHPAPYYQRTGFTLYDVLLPGEESNSIESLHQDFSQFTLSKVSADQADGGLSISFDPASVAMKGGGSLSKVFSITPQKKDISLESLEALRKERQINMDHSFIRQLQRTDINLFVVTEILEASEETAKFYATLCAQRTREDKQSIVIPKGCTLAFRTIKLHIRGGAWELPVNTQYSSDRFWFADPSQRKLEAVMEEVKHRCQIFSKLPPDLLLIVFNTSKLSWRHEPPSRMEEVPEENDGYKLKTKSPDLKDLFSTVQQTPRDRLLQLVEGITYILDALHELLEDQLLLLLKSLERKIVPQQLKLVRRHFTLGSFQGLLSFSQEEERDLTIALVLLSGVQLREDGSAVPRRKHYQAMAALFVALYALKLLSGSK
uniref:Uncharacterized protein n=1 Tax=Malurus cyaneus samueli TaxID=2593467 RepID=A0A8C5TNV1_9PASS